MDFNLYLEQRPSEHERSRPSAVHRPPEPLLRRHDAAMFEPVAVRHPTAHHRTALIVPAAVVDPASTEIRSVINEVLGPLGMRIQEPRSTGDDRLRARRHAVVRIRATSGDDSDVDALVAVQALY